jgi:hypothetical protein
MSRKIQNRGYTSILEPGQVFNLDGALLRVLPDIADRTLLLRRIRNFLSSRRRGRLRLPRYFPREVLLLTELTKRQLRDRVYAVRPNTSIDHRLPKSMVDYISRRFPGMIWNSPSTVLGHLASAVGMTRLRKTDWPGISRQRWPSTPSFSEMLAMSRRGLVTVGLDKCNFAVRNCISRQQVANDICLARKIVSYNIVGIRSSVMLPERFLPYFRVRNGISFLAVRYNIPPGLTRFLLSQWVCNPFNLWLKENCRFKIFLKRHTPSDFVREVSFRSDMQGMQIRASSVGKRTSTPSSETLEGSESRLLKPRYFVSRSRYQTKRPIDALLGPPCAVRYSEGHCPHKSCKMTWAMYY